MDEEQKYEPRFVFDNPYQQSLYYALKFWIYNSGLLTYDEVCSRFIASSKDTIHDIYLLNRLIENDFLKVVDTEEGIILLPQK
jgi:hypothetical protein